MISTRISPIAGPVLLARVTIRSSTDRPREPSPTMATEVTLVMAAPFLAGWSASQPDPHPAVLLALVLHLVDLHLADLAGGGDVRAPVGLHVKADDVHQPHVLGLGRYHRLGADDVGDGERLLAGEPADVDPPVGLDLDVH